MAKQQKVSGTILPRVEWQLVVWQTRKSQVVVEIALVLSDVVIVTCLIYRTEPLVRLMGTLALRLELDVWIEETLHHHGAISLAFVMCLAISETADRCKGQRKAGKYWFECYFRFRLIEVTFFNNFSTVLDEFQNAFLSKIILFLSLWTGLFIFVH